MASIDVKTVFRSIVIGLVVAAGLFFLLFILHISWMKILILSLTLGCGVTWFLSHGKLKKALKFLVLSLLIFITCFAFLENHFFWNAGFPPTYDASKPEVTLSYPSILNVSLTELIQGVEETAAFKLFELEHFGVGETTFYSIELSTSPPEGIIRVEFYNDATSMSLRFSSSAGHQYIARTTLWSGSPSHWWSSQQQSSQALTQIDNLGLQWFYDRVSEIYQNRTGTALNATTLDVTTEWQEYNDYSGMILQIIGGQRDGNNVHGIVFAAFQPDGTLLYLNCKTA